MTNTEFFKDNDKYYKLQQTVVVSESGKVFVGGDKKRVEIKKEDYEACQRKNTDTSNYINEGDKYYKIISENIIITESGKTVVYIQDRKEILKSEFDVGMTKLQKIYEIGLWSNE